MNNMYYNDYFNTGYPHDLYPIKGSDYCCDECNRNNASLDSLSNNSYSSNCSSISDDRVDSFFNPNEGFAKGNMQANIYQPYKLTNPSLPVASNERERLLLEVQKYSFAMWDLNLYLNTHPTDRNIMMLFDQYRTSYKKAINDYENRYGPLHVENTSTNSGYWAWNRSPWPWEVE